MRVIDAGRSPRSGSVLIIVAVLSLIIFGALFSLSSLTRTDVATTSNLIEELKATYTAESIVAQIEAQVNSRPWPQRFWLWEAQATGTSTSGTGIVPMLTFDQTTPYVKLTKGSMAQEDFSFVGHVKDLPGTLREYRIYLEVTVENETFAFSWDKRHETSLLAGLNHETTFFDKVLENGEDPAGTVDAMLNQVKSDAQAASPPDGSDAQQKGRLNRLRKDEKSFKARAITPDPENPPLLPEAGGGGGGGDKGGK